jgi:glycerol-3-phosphate acyltransferase PlsY
MPLIITGVLIGLLIIFKHRGNIRRLLNGTEPRMGEKHQ